MAPLNTPRDLQRFAQTLKNHPKPSSFRTYPQCFPHLWIPRMLVLTSTSERRCSEPFIDALSSSPLWKASGKHGELVESPIRPDRTVLRGLAGSQ